MTEKHPLSRAVSCGLWVSKGTRDEQPGEEGLAHFVEHLVFKRTSKRNAYEISRDMEAVGGELNAFTSRESTCFVSHSLKEHIGLSLDLLTDLVFRPKFDAGDIKKEKQVVIQEIHMSEDQLEDNIFDLYLKRTYPKSPLGKPILGSVASITDMSRQKIVDFHLRQYRQPNLLLAVAGNVEHDEVVSLSEKLLKFSKAETEKHGQLKAAPSPPLTEQKIAGFRDTVKRPSEQAHILIGFPASDVRSGLRFEGSIINSWLGGGMTSQLYQKVREERGLVYSIYSQLVTFVDSGLNLVYAGTEPKHAPEVIELTFKEIKKLKKSGIRKAELEFFKTQVKGQILLGADDIENRMNALAINESIFGIYRSVDDVIRDIENISPDTIQEYIDRYVNLDCLGVLVLGQVPEKPTRTWLESL